jgi:hypothetical protein
MCQNDMKCQRNKTHDDVVQTSRSNVRVEKHLFIFFSDTIILSVFIEISNLMFAALSDSIDKIKKFKF